MWNSPRKNTIDSGVSACPPSGGRAFFFDRGISMRTVTLGPTGIVTPQNAFGALPIQRVSEEDAVALLRRAFEAA